jgi:hypothetical protein
MRLEVRAVRRGRLGPQSGARREVILFSIA